VAVEDLRIRFESIAPLLAVSWSNWTLYQELFSRLRTHRSVIDSLGDAVLLLDREGRLIGYNPAALTLFGLSEAEFEGRLVRELLSLPNGTDWSEKIVAGQGIPSFQTTLARPHQSPVEALVLNYPVSHPISWKGLWLTVVVRDITKQRELDDLRSDFTATLSHELRTPLTSMKGYLQTLMHRKARSFDMDKIQSIVGVINGQADQLQRLIQELLEAAKIRSQDLEIQPQSCDVEALLRDCLADAYNPKVRHTLECQSNCWAHCDPERIRAVVEHLLSNAQKYSLPGGLVEVGCAQLENFVRVWVRDEGVGIPVDQQEKIFEMYHRLDTGNRRTHYGIGVGLYIARKVVEGHGGRITVESAPGCGAVFTFTLPAAKA
jgi:PAS domain S-box-containing protein